MHSKFSVLSRIFIAGTSAAALSLGAGGFASAATSTANFQVTASVSSVCIIAATNLAFGAYDPTAPANTTANSTLTVTCTKGNNSAVVGIGPGLHSVGTQRNMIDSASDNLAYNLYQPPSNVPNTACVYTGTPTQWGDGTSQTAGTTLALQAAPSIAPRSYFVCGSIPAGQNVPASTSYIDATVVATVTF